MNSAFREIHSVSKRFRFREAQQMNALNCGRYAIGICAAVSILGGCGGRAGGDSTPTVPNVGTDVRHHQTFLYTGAKQTFMYPQA